MSCSSSKTVVGARTNPQAKSAIDDHTIFVLCNDNWTGGFRHTLPTGINAIVDDLALGDERPKLAVNCQSVCNQRNHFANDNTRP